MSLRLEGFEKYVNSKKKYESGFPIAQCKDYSMCVVWSLCCKLIECLGNLCLHQIADTFLLVYVHVNEVRIFPCAGVPEKVIHGQRCTWHGGN